jgi:hypothetical protein
MLIDCPIMLGCIRSPSDLLIHIKSYCWSDIICFDAGNKDVWDFKTTSSILIFRLHERWCSGLSIDLPPMLRFDNRIGLITKPLKTSSKCSRPMQPLHTLDTNLIPIDDFEANPSLAFARSFVDAGNNIMVPI